MHNIHSDMSQRYTHQRKAALLRSEQGVESNDREASDKEPSSYDGLMIERTGYQTESSRGGSDEQTNLGSEIMLSMR